MPRKTLFTRDANRQGEKLSSRSLQFRTSTYDEKNHSVEFVLATEAPVRVMDWERWELILESLLVSGMQFPEQIPLLDTHDRSSIGDVLGSIRNIRVEKTAAGSVLVGRVFFSQDDDGIQAEKKVAGGHLTDISVGYEPIQFQDIQPNQSAVIDGRTFAAGSEGLRVTFRSVLKEASLTAIGADQAAKVRTRPTPTRSLSMKKYRVLAAGTGLGEVGSVVQCDPKMVKSMVDEKAIEEVAEETPLTGKSEPAPATAAAPAPVTTPAPAAPAARNDGSTAEGQRAERARVMQIRKLAGSDIPAEMVDKAIDEGWDAARASEAFLMHVRSKPAPAVNQTPGTVTVGATGQEAFARTMTNACVSRAMTMGGMRFNPAGIGSAELAEMDKFRSIGMHDLARLALRVAGVQDYITNPDELFRRALVSTSSFPEILSDAAVKTLRQTYLEYPGTFLTWAQRLEVPDFKQYRSLVLSEFGSIGEIGDGQEIQAGALKESRENYQAKTYGREFSITRKNFINDDLGAFLQIPVKLGRAAKRNIDDIAYALLVSNSGVGPTMNEDTVALFSAGRLTPNYIASTPTLGITGLSRAKQLMRSIKGLGGEFLGAVPKFLIVPPELEQIGQSLTMSGLIVAGGSAEAAAQGNQNIHQNSVTLVVEPRLSAATNGTTAYYVAADPAQVASLAFVSLRGQAEPMVQRKDPTDTLGIGWLMYHDAGVAAVDWRGIVRIRGA